MVGKEEQQSSAIRSKLSSDPSASALMLSIIRTLTNASSSDQKQSDCQRLEAGFKESSHSMDKLVQKHENDVGTCLDSFKKVSTRITKRIHSVRAGLMTCRSLLQCRRDDLKRLWTENAQQRHISNVLAQIEQLKKIENSVDETVAKGNYLLAANLLSEADLLLNGPFSNIDGLNDLRNSVHQKSKKLVEHIMDDLINHLITRPFQWQLLEIIKSLPENKVIESRECIAVLNAFSDSNRVDQKSFSLSNSNSDNISDHLSQNIQALCVFKNLYSTLSHFIQLMPTMLLRQIHITASVVCNAFSNSAKGDVENLTHYLNLILNQLKSSYIVHCALDDGLKKLTVEEAGNDENFILLSSKFWEMAQDAIEKVVVEYVQINSINPTISQKRSNTGEKFSLFKFDASACAASVRNRQSSKKMQLAICEPSPWNITVLYPLLEKFCCEREAESGEKPCKLRKFLHSFIIDVFIDRFKNKLELLAEQALQGRDAWRLVHYPSPKVLASCYNMFVVCEEIGKLIQTMENYTERLSALWLLVIDEFAKSTMSVYEKMLHSNDEEEKDRRKISAAWAVDEDISRLLKSLPNWFAVSHHEATPTPSATTPTVLLPANESESEIRQRNERESEILIGNLGTAKQLVRDELITDMELISSLACMHDSLKWFCTSMRTLISTLPDSCRRSMRKCIIQIQNSSKNSKTQQESIYAAVERRLAELDSTADTCLLIIHLELRVHCFFHLLPLARTRSSLPHDELDNEVIDLGRDLTHFHQALHSCLPPHKMKYLFDGLGHLSASIFIHSSQHMQKLTENGKKRVCRNIFAVQQRLSHLTGRRESELERARAFFELLNHDPDQLLALILERGAVFSHLEYTYLLALAIRSHPILSAQPGALEQRISQLKQILSQIKKS